MLLNSRMGIDKFIYKSKSTHTLTLSPDLIRIADLKSDPRVVLVNADFTSMPVNHPLPTISDYEFAKLHHTFATAGVTHSSLLSLQRSPQRAVAGIGGIFSCCFD